MVYTDEALTDENGHDIAVRRLAYSRWQHANSAKSRARPDRDASIRRRSRAPGNHRPNNFADWLLTLLVAKRGGVLVPAHRRASLAAAPTAKVIAPVTRTPSGAFATASNLWR